MKRTILLTGILFLYSMTMFGQKSKDVAMFMGNPEHTGTTNNSNVNHFNKLKWKFKTNGKIYSSPVIQEGIAYIGSEDKNLYAIDAKSGQEKWRFTTGGAVHSTPAVYNGTVCFLSFDGYFYALDSKTGQEKWKFKTGGEKWIGQLGLWGMAPADMFMEDIFQYFLSSPVIDNSATPTVFFGSSDSHLYSLDLNTGKLNWKFKTGAEIHTSPALHNGTLFFGSWDRAFYAVDAKTGTEKWRFNTKEDNSGWGGQQGIQSSPLVYNGKVYFGARDAFFYALNEKTGALVWEYFADYSWVLGSAAVHNGIIYAGTSDSAILFALDAETGQHKYNFKTNGYVYSTPAISGNTAFFGNYTGKMISLDLNSQGKSWEEYQLELSRQNYSTLLNTNQQIDWGILFGDMDGLLYESNVKAIEKLDQLAPIVSTPSIVNNVIYFASVDGYVYAVSLSRNNAPKVAIASPKRGAEYLTGSDISIIAATMDGDDITGVDYYSNGVKLGSNATGKFELTDAPAGKYTLRIKATDSKGGISLSDTLSIYVKDSLVQSEHNCERKNDISEAYVSPNPFENQSTFYYELNKKGNTKITLYNNEKLVKELLNKKLEAGKHEVVLTGLSLKDGTYYLKIQNGKTEKTIRFVKR